MGCCHSKTNTETGRPHLEVRLSSKLEWVIQASRVLGVAWDPRDRYICTTSADRTCRVWARNKRKSFYPKAVVRTYDAKVMAKEADNVNEALEPGTEDSVPASLAERTVREKIFINDSHYAHDATAHFFR